MTGVTVMPEWFQQESIEGVLNNLTRARVNAVAASPCVMERGGEKTRLLDRSLWGKRVQFGGPLPDDAPRLPDGRVPPRRLANNGSLASPHILAYVNALTRDLLGTYPDIDGFRHGWPEDPPYFLDGVFLQAARLQFWANAGYRRGRVQEAARRLDRCGSGRSPDIIRRHQPVYVLIHGYGSVRNFKARAATALKASRHGSGSTATATSAIKSWRR